MEKFNPEASPRDNEEDRANGESGKGVGRRRFVKLLGTGAALAATGSIMNSTKEASAEGMPTTGFQIVDGRAVLWKFDAKGNAESYEIVGTTTDLGLAKKD